MGRISMNLWRDFEVIWNEESRVPPMAHHHSKKEPTKYAEKHEKKN
jgi:hypothetical protein